MTLKQQVTEICHVAATKHPGWKYTAGEFRYPLFTRTYFTIDPSFTYSLGSVLTQAAAALCNTEYRAVNKSLFDQPISKIDFVTLSSIDRKWMGGTRFCDPTHMLEPIAGCWMIDALPAHLEMLFDVFVPVLSRRFDVSSERVAIETAFDAELTTPHLGRSREFRRVLVKAMLGDMTDLDKHFSSTKMMPKFAERYKSLRARGETLPTFQFDGEK